MPSNVFSQDRGSRSIPQGQTSRRWAVIILLFFAVLLPEILSFGILCRQALPVPYQDDYDTILDFAIGYKQLAGFKAKVFDIAAAQHNEYKLVFEHAIIASELELTHHLNFGLLTVLGNCFLLAIGCMLWKMYSGDGDLQSRLLRFLPISLLFFSITYWEDLNWATTDLQNIPVVFFSLLAIYLLVSTPSSGALRLHVIAAYLTAALAAFTSANGFLLAPVGLLFLLLRRAYASSLMWCASFVIPLTAYLYHYAPQHHALHRFFYLTRPLCFLAFLGCAILSRGVAVLLGIAVLAVILLATRARFDRSNPAAFYSMIWLIATAVLVAWVRGGSAFDIASRYSIYSVLLLIFCYSFLADYLPGRLLAFQQKRFYAASLVFAFGVWLMGNVSAYKQLGARQRMVLRGIEVYRAAPEANSPMIDPQVEWAFPKEKKSEQVILTKAIQEGIYTLPPEQDARQ